jgi:DNA-binding transcriptional LysR family regulator
MDHFKAMKVFLEVANCGSFAPAAKKLNISPSAVTRHIKDLEEWLDTSLFQRTTRKIQLTEAGKTYLLKCQEVIDSVDDLRKTATDLENIPQGEVKVTMPHWMAERYLCPKLPSFLKKYPNIKVVLSLIDQPVSLEIDGCDLAVGCGLSKLKNSSLVARKFADDELFLVASPQYLKKNGTPKTINDLKHHNCIIDNASPFENKWPLRNSNKTLSVPGKVWVNNGEIAKQLAIDGVGITLLPKIFISKEMENGNLVSFLKKYINFKGHLYIIYKPAKTQTKATKIFVDFTIKCFKNIL